MQVREEKNIEKRAISSKPRVNYNAIIKELFRDNQELQQKLNETLQALQRCIQQDPQHCQKQVKQRDMFAKRGVEKSKIGLGSLRNWRA